MDYGFDNRLEATGPRTVPSSHRRGERWTSGVPPRPHLSYPPVTLAVALQRGEAVTAEKDDQAVHSITPTEKETEDDNSAYRPTQ